MLKPRKQSRPFDVARDKFAQIGFFYSLVRAQQKGAGVAANSIVQRSTFVTTLAWVFIVLGGFATLIALLQNIMLTVMLPEGIPPIEQSGKAEDIPAFARFMFDNFRLIFAGFLVLSAVTLSSAIGLLKRMNWARLSFIGIMSLGILWNIATVALTFFVFSSIPFPESAPPDFREQHELMNKIMMYFTLVMAVCLTALFAWIIKRLVSNDVVREFVAL